MIAVLIVTALGALVATVATVSRRRGRRDAADVVGEPQFASEPPESEAGAGAGPSRLDYACYIAGLCKSPGEPELVTRAIAKHGLAVAVDGYDAESGVDFLTYATPVILREARSRHRDVRTPGRSRYLADTLNGTADRITRQTGRSPTIGELAMVMGVWSEEIVESLDTALGFSATSFGTPDVGPDLGFMTGLNSDQVKHLLAPLPERNKRIVMMRYLRGMSDAQIGAELNISPVHVSRLLNQAMNALLP